MLSTLIVFLGVWVYALIRFEDYRLFICFLPLALVINISKNVKVRNSFIVLFSILWLLAFHYESIRYFYLQPFSKSPLYKVKFLFPPAGWIMFFNVGPASGDIQIYGTKGNYKQLIDPHDIFRTRTIAFDNIHRGIVGGIAGERKRPETCRYLFWKFPGFDYFDIHYVDYPDVTQGPYIRREVVLFRCQE